MQIWRSKFRSLPRLCATCKGSSRFYAVAKETDAWGNWAGPGSVTKPTPSTKEVARASEDQRKRPFVPHDTWEDFGRPTRDRSNQDRRKQERGGNREYRHRAVPPARGSSAEVGPWQANERQSPRRGVPADADEAARWERQRTLQSDVADAREKLKGDVVLYGLAPVLTALRAERRTLHSLLIQAEVREGGKHKSESAMRRQIMTLATAADLCVLKVSKHVLNTLADNRPHQGVLLDCTELGYEPLARLPSAMSVCSAASGGAKWPVWLALDQIVDPQNLGAILRSAYFLGVSGVLGSAKNCAPLSPVASKASAGALEMMNVHSCSNLANALSAAQEEGWAVLGADSAAGAIDCGQVTISGPTVIVVGSEGAGLRTNVRRACCQLVRIAPGADADQGIVDSLNVSVATGILLHRLLGQ